MAMQSSLPFRPVPHSLCSAGNAEGGQQGEERQVQGTTLGYKENELQIIHSIQELQADKLPA